MAPTPAHLFQADQDSGEGGSVVEEGWAERGGGRSLAAWHQAAREERAKPDTATLLVAHLARFIGTQAQDAVEDLKECETSWLRSTTRCKDTLTFILMAQAVGRKHPCW